MTVVDIDPQDYFQTPTPQSPVPVRANQPVVLQTEGGLTPQQIMILTMFLASLVALIIVLYIISKSNERRR